MKYLVTGGSGFIGSHVVEALLKNGHSVINVDNFDEFYDYRLKIRNTLDSVGKEDDFIFTGKERDLLHLQDITASETYLFYYQDITDELGMQKIFRTHRFDAIIHLAALAGVRPSIERPLQYEKVNVQGTLLLWELCRKFKVRKFLNASSSSVYGNNEKTPFAETDAVDHAISPYAATKRCTEILGHVYHHLYGIDMVHLRFFTVYGPRQRPDLAIRKFAALITDNVEVPFYGDGKSARDYTYIDDIVDGVLCALNYVENVDAVFEIINLGGDKMISLDAMLETLETNLCQKATRKFLPMQPGDVQRTSADITKANRLCGYKPATDFQFGIKKFVEWFLKNRG